MNYELAKQLKDAGFPQEEKAGEVLDDEGLPAIPGNYEGRLYVPTLIELIEACGDSFGALHKVLDYWEACGGEYQPMDQDCAWKFMLKDSTPEQAVANLWLALNQPL